MYISISNIRSIQEVQEEFNAAYPFLRLAFFDNSHEEGQMNKASDMLSNTLSLAEVRKSKQEGNLFVSPKMLVSELENLFSELYELNVQVQRKSGDLWLVTSATDSWSLEKQNIEGESFSHPEKE